VRAARLDAIRRRLDHSQQPPFVEVAIALQPLPLDDLARQRIVDEHGFAVDVRDAATFVRNIGDRRRFRLARRTPARLRVHGRISHASTNS
jgi:hypothetical protein